MYIGNLKNLNCEIHLIKLIILVTAIKVKMKSFQFTVFMISETDPEKKGCSN